MNSDPSRSYLDPAVLNRVKSLELKARMVVEGFISGLHKSPYNGYSVEFAAYREYVPGDEVKHIDWKRWARADKLYIKQYEEETNMSCSILFDCSRSMAYGQEEEGGSKFDYAATLSASLAYLLQSQQDAVGLVTFDTEIRKRIPAGSHPNQLRQIVHHLAETEPSQETDVSDVFRSLANSMKQRGLVVVVSDCFVDLDTLETSLRQFQFKGHDVMLCHVMHEHELSFPFTENTRFRGMEQHQEIMTEPRALRRSYLAAVERFLTEVRRVCSKHDVDYLKLSTADPLEAALAGYMAFRQNRGRK